MLSGRLPPVEEEIVAVEDSIAGRASDQLIQRRNDFQLHDHSPYCASTSTTPVSAATIVVTSSSPQTLLNYMQMDQSNPSYLSNPQFANAHRSLASQQQSRPQQQQQYHLPPQEQIQRQPHLNEPVFSHPTKMSPSTSSSQVNDSFCNLFD